jgi:hypothetical protein
MAETAGSVIKSALQEILVQASEAPLEPDETIDALLYMNRFMAEQAANGIALGFTEVDDTSDEITIPGGAINGLVFNLAMKLAPQFGKVVSITLATNAKDALATMRNIAVTIGRSQFPNTLPRGSGNEDDGVRQDQFYPDHGGQILTEQTGPILLEDDTIA